MHADDVTVVIPVHDGEGALSRAVDSVLHQSAPPARIIVVDDGSTDRSAAVAAALPVTLLRHPEARGSGPARNTGIAAADTEWIAFLDSDDRWSPGHLAAALPVVEDHVLVTAPMVDSFGRGHGNVSGEVRPIRFADLFFPENIVCTSTVLARRSAIEAVGGFGDLPRAQDLDLWVKLLGVGSGIALPVPSAVYDQPSRYQEASLRERSAAGARQVRARYGGERWMTTELSRAIEARLAWDDLRHAQHHRDARGALSSLRRLEVRPSTATALRHVLAHRRLARRFSPIEDA